MDRKRAQVSHVAQASVGAKLVKLADKISNLRSIGDAASAPSWWSEKRVRGYFYWAMAVTRQCRGINTALDAMLDEIYKEKGIEESRLEQELADYYALLLEEAKGETD